jgi:hypothetical protein
MYLPTWNKGPTREAAMATLGARVDDDFYDRVSKAAAAEGIKVSTFLSRACEEKMLKGNGSDRYQPPLFPKADHDRALIQLGAVKNLMADGKWRSIPEVAAELRAPDTSIPAIGARVRDLRKAVNGGHTVDKRQRRPGYWEYQLVLSANE